MLILELKGYHMGSVDHRDWNFVNQTYNDGRNKNTRDKDY